VREINTHFVTVKAVFTPFDILFNTRPSLILTRTQLYNSIPALFREEMSIHCLDHFVYRGLRGQRQTINDNRNERPAKEHDQQRLGKGEQPTLTAPVSSNGHTK
jgi:hypothetical protein